MTFRSLVPMLRTPDLRATVAFWTDVLDFEAVAVSDDWGFPFGGGTRLVICSHPRTKPGQRLDKVLAVPERAWIRHFLAEGHDLVNQQGTKIRRHEITSTGRAPRRFLPSQLWVERFGRE